MEYRGFTLFEDDYGYRILNNFCDCDLDCGFFHTYNEAVSAIERFYRLKEV